MDIIHLAGPGAVGRRAEACGVIALLWDLRPVPVSEVLLHPVRLLDQD